MNTFGFSFGFCFMVFDAVVFFTLAMIFKTQIPVEKKKKKGAG